MNHPLLIQLFSHAPLDQRILMGSLEELLGEKRMAKVLDGLFPSAPIGAGTYEGRRMDEYRGMSRAQLKQVFSFSDGQVDELYELLGATDNSADVDGAREGSAIDGESAPADDADASDESDADANADSTDETAS
jgi:hypothetical protein